MAAIDKIYGDYSQWVEFHYWLGNSKRPQYCKYLYPTPTYGLPEGPIANFPRRADAWLYRNCPLKWVTERIKEQYGGEAP